MWTCSRCGKTQSDNVNACGHCGAARDLAAKKIDAELSDPDAPELVDDSVNEGATDEDDGEADQSADRPLTEVGFATVMLRLLGVYFATFGAVGLLADFAHLVVYANKTGLEKTLQLYTLDYFARSIFELLVGLYFLLGGQWVFDKILTPVRRHVEDDEFEDRDEEV